MFRRPLCSLTRATPSLALATRRGRLRKAIRQWQFDLAEGKPPDFDDLHDASFQPEYVAGYHKIALELFAESRSKGLLHSRKAYNSMLQLFCKLSLEVCKE